MDIKNTSIIIGKKSAFVRGMYAGFPIGLGYFAVSFSMGVAARNAGLSVLQGVVASLMTNASAGQYAVFTQIATKATLLEIAIMTLVTNARYLLMSCALGQRLAPGTGIGHRLLLGSDITDELFGITIAQEGYINPFYTYGAILTSCPFWAAGTGFGIWMGELLPLRIVSALSVALYGMFLAVIIPPARKNQTVCIVVIVSFLMSILAGICPIICNLSTGNKTILLTLGISAAAALLAPVPVKEEV